MSIAPEILYGIGAVILGLGIVYGWWRYATRNKAKDAQTESATRLLYDTTTRDDPEPSPEELAQKKDRQPPTVGRPHP